MNKFSRMLSVAACALFAAAAGPAFAGQCGMGPCNAGYDARAVGHYSLAPQPVKAHGVKIYRGRHMGWRRNASEPVHGVNVYTGGGGFYVNGMRAPDYVEALEVVTVTRGTGQRQRTVDAICMSRDGHTMPAARVRRATHMTEEMAVELFRCEGGFALHGIVSRAGRASRGDTINCSSGASLWSAPNGGVQCRAKRPLDLSEAELRHAFGAGPIVLTSGVRADHAAVTVTRGMSLTGGVGYAPY
jgi:hypothetical protein